LKAFVSPGNPIQSIEIQIDYNFIQEITSEENRFFSRNISFFLWKSKLIEILWEIYSQKNGQLN
jgi:hypothetical protein